MAACTQGLRILWNREGSPRLCGLVLHRTERAQGELDAQSALVSLMVPEYFRLAGLGDLRGVVIWRLPQYRRQ